MAFQPATKRAARARVALLGPAGSGKTFTALRLAHQLAKGGKIAVIDTERGSASKYAGDANPDGGTFAFDVDDRFADFNVRNYIDAIGEAVRLGYAVLVIDSLSHAWAGPGGILEFVDNKQAGSTANKFAAWRDATPLHNKLVDTILNADVHILATMRTKMEYVLEDDGKGKKVPRKIGLQPVQRDGLEYEFDLILDCDAAAVTVSKSRCRALNGKRYFEPGKDLAGPFGAWLEAGTPPESSPPLQARPASSGGAAPAPLPTSPDPSWEADMPKFLGWLESYSERCEEEISYDTVAAFCASLTPPRPEPAFMTQDQRDRLVAALQGDTKVQQMFWQFRQGGHAAAAK